MNLQEENQLNWQEPKAFYISHYRFTISPRETLILPRLNKGITLRGAFGSSFRSLVCVHRMASCDKCDVHPTCPYGYIFSPRVPEGADRLRLNQDIPRPFVIKPPLEEREVFEPGDRLCFGLVIVGKAGKFLPYFLLSFRNLGEQGIGERRGKFEIIKVEAFDAQGEAETVMKQGDPMVQVPSFVIRFADLKSFEGDTPIEAIRVRFLTPVLIKREGKWVSPNFGTLMRRLRDRINALSYFYCNQTLEMDFRAFGEMADRIHTIYEDLRWIEEDRFSRYREIKHTLKGYMGSLIFHGKLAPFLLLLQMGQFIHVGKAAVFGQGWYRIETLNPDPAKSDQRITEVRS